MAIICPSCGKLNDEEKDETCPHCGVLYAKARHAQRQRVHEEAKRIKQEDESVWRMEFSTFVSRYPLVGVPLLLALLVGVLALCSQDRAVSPGSHERELIRGAERACENHIRAVAQRPSTVRFHISGLQAQVQDSGSVVTNHVFSAENMLGVRIRSRARCTVGSDGRVQSFSSVRQ